MFDLPNNPTTVTLLNFTIYFGLKRKFYVSTDNLVFKKEDILVKAVLNVRIL